MAVGQHGIGQRPEMLGGLKLGRVGGQEEQIDVLGHLEMDARVPARSVEHQDDLLAGACAYLLSKGRKLGFKEGNAY